MSFSRIYSGAIVGLEPYLVEVEINIDYQGLPAFTVVGLAAKEIDEAKERVRSAIKNSGYQFPNRRITVNLAPADLPKRGSLYDLPIAIGILSASGYITSPVDKFFLMGELSLNGAVNKISGAIPLAIFAKDKFTYVCLPRGNAEEVSVIRGIKIKPVKKLSQLAGFVNGDIYLRSYPHKSLQEIIDSRNYEQRGFDFKDIKGQEAAKRGLEIAAAGGHNISLIGPPGAGKTLLSRAIVSILPTLTESEAIDVTKIYSIAGQLQREEPFIVDRPFRAPHHSTSKAGLLGGGSPISPGEISLAHLGVLFIDEFPELNRDIVESLRQPIENNEITISRARGSVTFPSNFMLVIASNPCPCGNLGNPQKQCVCNNFQIRAYQNKISGPIIDRIDMHVICSSVEIEKLEGSHSNIEPSEVIRKRVQKARVLQVGRYKNERRVNCNADLDAVGVEKYCGLGVEKKKFMRQASIKFGLSARAYHKVIKVARTIADLEGVEKILVPHIAEALQYRFSGFS